MCCIKTKTSSSMGNLEQVVYGHFPKAHHCFSYGECGSACAYQPTIRYQGASLHSPSCEALLYPPPRQLLHVHRCACMLDTVLQGGVDDLDGSIVGCVQWSPRQAQRG